jgi:mannosyltransferase
VVPAGDGPALQDAIEHYLADPDRVLRHGRNALEHARAAFDIGNEVQGLTAIYLKVFAK